LAVTVRNLDQLLERRVNYFLTRSTCPLVTDDSLVVDQIHRRRGGQVPLRRDRTCTGVAGVNKGSPGDLLLGRHLLELLRVEAADVDADEGERLVFQVLHERPLVWPLGPSRQSDDTPEVEQHHLPAIVTQLESLAFFVLAVDVRGFLADAQITNPEQF